MFRKPVKPEGIYITISIKTNPVYKAHKSVCKPNTVCRRVNTIAPTIGPIKNPVPPINVARRMLNDIAAFRFSSVNISKLIANKAPAIPAKKPDPQNDTYRTQRIEYPTNSALSGLSLTALDSFPTGVCVKRYIQSMDIKTQIAIK